MRPTRVSLIACCLALCASATDPWTRVRSSNFELFTTAGDRSGRDLVLYLEQVRSFFAQAFRLSSSAEHPLRIISFSSEKEFQQYRPSEVADAFFQSGESHDYIVMTFTADGSYPTAVHEYTHLLLRQTRLDIPLWLSEGLAELYSNLQPNGAEILVGMPIPMRMQALLREPWIDLRSIVTVDAVSSQKERAAMFYAESWALVHMLSLDNRYSPHLRELFDAIEAGQSAHSFDVAYGKTLARVQEDLRSYIHRSSMNTAIFDLKLSGPPPQLRVDANSGLGARLALAELMSNERHGSAQAEAAYRSLAREYQRSPDVEEAWAEFYARERRNPEAIRHFTRAEGLGGRSPRLYLEYARVLSQTSHSAEAIAALRDCLRLDPTLDEAHFELAVTLVRAGKDSEAVSEFHQIKKLGPEFAYRYFYYLAVAHGRLGDIAQSRRLIEKARPETRSSEERSALDRLFHSLGPE